MQRSNWWCQKSQNFLTHNSAICKIFHRDHPLKGSCIHIICARYKNTTSRLLNSQSTLNECIYTCVRMLHSVTQVDQTTVLCEQIIVSVMMILTKPESNNFLLHENVRVNMVLTMFHSNITHCDSIFEIYCRHSKPIFCLV